MVVFYYHKHANGDTVMTYGTPGIGKTSVGSSKETVSKAGKMALKVFEGFITGTYLPVITIPIVYFNFLYCLTKPHIGDDDDYDGGGGGDHDHDDDVCTCKHLRTSFIQRDLGNCCHCRLSSLIICGIFCEVGQVSGRVRVNMKENFIFPFNLKIRAYRGHQC